MKLFTTCFFMICCLLLTAQNLNIPNADFKDYLVRNKEINKNNDKEIQLEEAENFVGEISIDKLFINDLTGLAFFKIKS